MVARGICWKCLNKAEYFRKNESDGDRLEIFAVCRFRDLKKT